MKEKMSENAIFVDLEHNVGVLTNRSAATRLFMNSQSTKVMVVPCLNYDQYEQQYLKVSNKKKRGRPAAAPICLRCNQPMTGSICLNCGDCYQKIGKCCRECLIANGIINQDGSKKKSVN